MRSCPCAPGDLVKLFLVKRRVEAARYPTLAASLLVETIVDAILSGALLIWAVRERVLPGVHVLDRMPSVDWFWLFRHPRAAIAVAAAMLVLGFVSGLWAAAKIVAFRHRVAQGFAVLRSPTRFLRGVVSWQLVDRGLRLATIYFFLRAFHVPATYANVLRVQVTQSLSTIVPLTAGRDRHRAGPDCLRALRAGVAECVAEPQRRDEDDSRDAQRLGGTDGARRDVAYAPLAPPRRARSRVAGLVLWHDHDRAGGMVSALLADRAEEETAEASGTARPDDEKVGVLGGIHQCGRGLLALYGDRRDLHIGLVAHGFRGEGSNAFSRFLLAPIQSIVRELSAWLEHRNDPPCVHGVDAGVT
jgi:hypothetical protein